MLADRGFWSLVTALDPFPVGLVGFLPNLVATLAIALALGAVASSRLDIRRWPTTLWLVSILVPLAYTWTPSWGYGAEACTAGVWPWDVPGPRLYYEMTTNVALMAPAGAAAWLWSLGTPRLVALVIALAVPPVIETVQRWSPQLGSRACQMSDVAFNLMGVFVGFAIVATIVALRDSWLHSRAHPGQE